MELIRQFFTVALLLCTVSLFSQPVNDECVTAIDLTANLDVGGTCVSVSEDNSDPGFATGWEYAPNTFATGFCTGIDSVVFFSFIAQGVSANIDITNIGGETPHISVFTFATPCDFNTATEIGCEITNQMVLDNALTVGTTYIIMVGSDNQNIGTGAGFGPFDICVYNPTNPANDNCADAIDIAELDDDACTVGQDNYYPSTQLPAFPGCWGQVYAEVWYSFVAQGVSIADLHIENFTGVGNPYIAVLDGNCGDILNMTVLGCGANGDPILTDHNLVIGTTYYIVVAWENYASGTFDLCLDNPVPAFNDECMDAPVIPPLELSDDANCLTSIEGNNINNDHPSTDIGYGTFGCWNAGDTYSVWYQFVAQGPDLDVTVIPNFAAAPEIALVSFTTPCDVATGTVIECEYDDVLSVDNQLTIGSTYYLAVGFENNMIGDYCINVFNPVPPHNDTMCSPLALDTDGACNTSTGAPCPPLSECFTTQYANPEYTAAGFPGDCADAVENTVWYTLNMQDANNVGFTIDFDYLTMSGDVSLTLWTNVNGICNDPNEFNLVYFYCGGEPSEPIEFAPILDETLTYYLMVGSSEVGEGSFSICVDEIEPCFDNNFCDDPNGFSSATIIDNVVTDQGFICAEYCNQYADNNEFAGAGCDMLNNPTVWFAVPVDGTATLMNVSVQSDDITAPTIQIYSGDCAGLIPVPVNDGNTCIQGTSGQALAAAQINTDETYYIAISGINTIGGDFELCINTLEDASSCVLASNQYVADRSIGDPGDLDGPFLPDEVVTVCFEVTSYTPQGNGCQWFQGVVPVFGNGWDPSSFNAIGLPNVSTMNGNAYPTPGIYTGTWGEYDDITYNNAAFFYQVGDFDGNGSLDLCNSNFDPDCVGPGLPDDGLLPPGWFVWSPNGGQGGHPSVDWGDGAGCAGPFGAWTFCMELTVRGLDDCGDDETTNDLTVNFFTFADGETGDWNGNLSVCALDLPSTNKYPMCCVELVEDSEVKDPICANGTFTQELDDQNADFWEWTVEAGGVTGATDGSGPPGTIVVNTLTNPGSIEELVTYTFLGYEGGDCPSRIFTVEITVYPEIEATLDPILMCATPTNAYSLTPNVSGGSGNYNYAWNDNDGTTDMTLMIDNPSNGQLIVVTVTDDTGCEGTASLVLDVYETFPVDIIPSNTAQCIQDGDISLDALASGGTGVFNSYDWVIPGGINSGQTIDVNESGQYLVVVTDDQGCQGRDSIPLNFFEAPSLELDAGDDFICDGSTTQIFSLLTQVVPAPPYTYEWDHGPTTSTINVTDPDTYVLVVTDANGCTVTESYEINLADAPVVPLDPEYNICSGEAFPQLDLAGQAFTSIIWSDNLNAQINQEQVVIPAAGDYFVRVTNDEGCVTRHDFSASFFEVDTLILQDQTLCQGNAIDVVAPAGWDNYDWQHIPGPSNDPDIIIAAAETYILEVTDANGCTREAELIVTDAAFLTPIDTGALAFCPGGQTTLGVLQEFDVYSWVDITDDQTELSDDETYTTSVPGTYVINVLDVNGCAGADTITVIEDVPNVIIGGPSSICENSTDSLHATPGFATYMWSTGASTPSIEIAVGMEYRVTVSNALGCVAADTVTVTEDGLQPQIQGDTFICYNAIGMLDAGNNGYTSYTWSTGPADNMQMLAVTDPGVYYVTVTNAQSCVGIDSFEVIENAEPTAMVTGDNTFCIGGEAVIEATAGFTSYVWSTGAPALTTRMIAVNQAGVYSVTVTDENGCTTTASTTIDPPFQIPFEIGDTARYCVGSNGAPLDAGNGYVSYTWNTTETTQTIVANAEGNYWVDVVDANGCTARDTIYVQEDTELSPNILGDNALCEGDDVELNAGAGFTTYAWENGPATQTYTVSTAGTYTVTVTDASGCTGTDQIMITVNPKPFAVVTSTASACNTMADGSTIDFSALVTGGDLSGTWADTDGTGVDLTDLTNVDFDAAGGPQVAPGLYQFTYTTGTAIAPCLDTSYVVNVTILDCDCDNVQVNPAANMCNDGGSLDLNTLYQPTTVAGGSWTLSGAPTGSSPVTLNGTMVDVTGADPGTYRFTYQVNGLPAGCLDTSFTELIVEALPSAGTPLMPAEVCVDEDTVIALTVLLDAADLGGQWMETSTVPSSAGAFSVLTAEFNTTGQVPGMYTFEYRVDNGGACPAVSETVEVMIEALPFADAGLTKEIDCVTDAVQLGGNGSSEGGDFVFTWTTQQGGNIISPNERFTMVDAPGIYTLTVMNMMTGCSSADDVEVTANGDFPTDILFVLDAPFCESEGLASIMIDAVVGGTAPYTYTLNDGPSMDGPILDNLSAGTYSLEVTDGVGCTFRLEDIEVPEQNAFTSTILSPDPDIQGAVGFTIVEKGDSLQFGYEVFGSSVPIDSVVWKYNEGVICDNCETLTWFPPDLTGIVDVEIYDENGCSSTARTEFTVLVPFEILVPNVITPNGDGINDIFNVFVSDPTAQVDRMEIFTRWGEKIFVNQENFQVNSADQMIGWNGKTMDGQDLMPGVYVYSVRVIFPQTGRREEELKGNITLLR